MPKETTGNSNGENDDLRSQEDRRGDDQRRETKKDSPEKERRNKDAENRRSWVGRRQAADWRKES